mmetsp:Transcript_9980/g.8502  ORF Transcript_9980/g.8502 Transcript_9980/m.8502 type:complete len:233 (+) Transcript_9980:25-723(+)
MNPLSKPPRLMSEALLFPQETLQPTEERTPKPENIALKVIKSAFPMILFNVSLMLLDTISLYFIGLQNNENLLSSLGFGITFQQAFSQAIATGIALGLSVYGSQSYGAKNFQLFNDYFKYTLLIQLLAFSLTVVLSLSCKDLLILAHFEEYLAQNVDTLMVSSLPCFFFMGLYQTFIAYFSCQNSFYINAFLTMLGLPIHWSFCRLFVDELGLELSGIGFSKGITLGALVLM